MDNNKNKENTTEEVVKEETVNKKPEQQSKKEESPIPGWEKEIADLEKKLRNTKDPIEVSTFSSKIGLLRKKIINEKNRLPESEAILCRDVPVVADYDKRYRTKKSSIVQTPNGGFASLL